MARRLTVNEILRNDIIKHAHYLESYKTSTINEILSLMNIADKELRAKLSKYNSINTFTKKRVNIMQKNVVDIINEANQVLKDRVNGVAKDLGTYESEYIINGLQRAVPKEVGLALVQPAPTQILSAIKHTYYQNTTMSKMFNDWSNRKKSKFNGAIQQGYLQGKGISEIVTDLFGTKKNKYVDGIAYGTRKQLATNVRTIINHISSTSRELTYDENKSVIKGVQWVATLDGRTTLICINLDGKVDYYDGKKELNGQRPPAHYNCRSTTVPVTKSLKEMGLKGKEFDRTTRASMNGQVSAKETYPTWFKKQSPEFQKGVLGKAKYEMYKNGDYDLSSFVANNNALTIEQIKDLDKK